MLLRRQATEERDEHIDMTPMVDVVFQLMTFMLFSLQMTGGEEVEVPPARHGVGVERDRSLFISMLRPTRPGDAPKIVIGLGDGAPASPEQIKAAVTQSVRDGRPDVVLQADGGVPHGAVLQTAAQIAEVEGALIHVGVQEYQ